MITVTHKVGIAVVAFNRPQAANALTIDLCRKLESALKASAGDRAILLTGNGKNFCAGADLKERKGMDEAAWHAQHAAFEAALQAILACPVPIIAAVNGAAFGGGLELALACDFIYAAQEARFALPEATLGIMPGLGGAQTLMRRIGAARAKEALFTGRAFSATEALAWGVINRMCPGELLMDETLATAHQIADNAPLAVKAIKRSINEGAAFSLDEALRRELAYYHALLPTADRREGIDAWNEKRKAQFTGH